MNDGSHVEEDTLEDLLPETSGTSRELHLMKSFPEYPAVPRAQVTGKVWRKGPKQVRARYVVRQFATSLDAIFYSPTLGLEVGVCCRWLCRKTLHFVR